MSAAMLAASGQTPTAPLRGRPAFVSSLVIALMTLTLPVACSKPTATSSDGKPAVEDDDGEKTTPKKKAKKKTPPSDDSDEPSKDDGEKKSERKKPVESPDKPDSRAINESDVIRYPDERKFEPPNKVKLLWNVARVHVAATGSSKVITVLAQNTEVTQLAQRPSGYVLITFLDPKKHSETLMGWIFRDAFKPMHVPAVKGKCPAGYTFDYNDCAKFCNRADECSGYYFCGERGGLHFCMLGETE